MDARCRVDELGLGADAWFSGDVGERAFARRVCDVCPAMEECLVSALTYEVMTLSRVGDWLGMVAGLTARERHRLLRKGLLPLRATPRALANAIRVCERLDAKHLLAG